MSTLSETGSLLVPLEIDGAPSFVLDGVVFARKVEHHLTVLGSRRGALVRAAAVIDPSLVARVNELAAAHAWNVSLLERFVLLSEPAPGGGELRTICVMASARIAELFAEVLSLISNANDDARRALALSLASPPPPHVTLYTTDPDGRRGIGLDTTAELDAALARGTPDDGMRARWLAPAEAPWTRLLASMD